MLRVGRRQRLIRVQRQKTFHQGIIHRGSLDLQIHFHRIADTFPSFRLIEKTDIIMLHKIITFITMESKLGYKEKLPGQ